LTKSFCHSVKFNPYNNNELVILTTNGSFLIYRKINEEYKLVKE